MNFGGAGQAGVIAEGHIAVLGKFFDVLLVNHDHRCQVRPFVANQHRIGDVGRKLQIVLEFAGGDVLAPCGDDNVFHAACDAVVTLGIDHPGVAGMQPALGVNCLCALLGQVQVTGKNIRSSHQYFPCCRVESYLVEARRRADGAGFDAIGWHAGAGTAGLGHAPHLQHGHAQGQIPAHQVRRNWRCAGDQIARTVDADEFAHIVECQPAGQLKLELEPGADRLTGQHPLGDAGTHADAPSVGGLLHRTGFFERNHHARVKLFPDPRHGGEHSWGDLAHVFRNGLGVFNKVEDGAGVERKILAAHALGNVAQGQKAHALVALILRHQRVVAAHREHQAAVQVHGALGPARGARGVDQNGQVFGAAGVNALLQGLGVLR